MWEERCERMEELETGEGEEEERGGKNVTNKVRSKQL